jgi:hypothetical protein
VKIERDGEWWLVSDRFTVVYGYGASLLAAIIDYFVSIWEYWRIMRRARGRDTHGR